MIRKILVPLSGTTGDDPVFETAWTVASTLQAHIEFFHVRISPGEAAIYTPHAAFVQGPAVMTVIAQLYDEGKKRSEAARSHVEIFCAARHLEMTDRPMRRRAVSVHFTEEIDSAAERLALKARHSDLVIYARPHLHNGLPPDLIDQLLVTAGRPFLLVGASTPRAFPGTVMVCWRESPEAARAVAAAMPLLTRATRVVVATVEGDEILRGSGPAELADSLAWHGIQAEPLVLPSRRRSAYEALTEAAVACSADLMVMGAYGHGRTREFIFGGCTRSMLDKPGAAVFMLH